MSNDVRFRSGAPPSALLPRSVPRQAAPPVCRPCPPNVVSNNVAQQKPGPVKMSPPAVYRPEVKNPVQPKAVSQRPVTLVFPPVYCPQRQPAGVQSKTAGLPKVKNRLAAPPVYCPRPAPEVLQAKTKTSSYAGVARKPFDAGSTGAPDISVKIAGSPHTITKKTVSIPIQLKAAGAQSQASVIQRGRFRSEVTKSDFVITPGEDKKKGYTLTMSDFGKSNERATLYYAYHGSVALMKHIETYGMPPGTGAGYLLLYVFALQAKKDGKTTVSIGLGVTRQSVDLNLEKAREEGDRAGIEEAGRNMAAVHIYEYLGFDATDAKTLSNSNVSVDVVLQKCISKLGKWTDLIERYYMVAPAIMAAMDRDPDRAQILEMVFSLICDCVSAIRNGRPERALELYGAMVGDLERRYCAAMSI